MLHLPLLKEKKPGQHGHVIGTCSIRMFHVGGERVGEDTVPRVPNNLQMSTEPPQEIYTKWGAMLLLSKNVK